MIKVPNFTKDEINYILDKANFTDQQHTLFMLRNKECSYEMCAEEMNVSIATVKRIAKTMNEKIRKVM
jgi:DNA-directed RNA polymerase specialized sigma24 family protein